MAASANNGSVGTPLPYMNNFQSQQHLAKRYTKIGIIGRGTFGTVYRGIDNEDPDKREVAIKVMDLESIEDDINNIMQEIIALRDCQSEHVPKYYHSFNIGPELWIVMEFMGGGSVHDYLDPKEQLGLESENLIALILREVTKGLAYLHSLKMIHRDIKAANILLSDNGNVKLADFGVVGRLTETIEKRMTMIGSPYWMAPEVIVPEKGKDDGYGTQADIWSLGILGIEMANGIPPHGDQHPFEAMRRIMEGPAPKLENGIDIEWTDHFKNFLTKCLEKDPKKRPSANELLKHEFFKDCGDLSDLKEELIDAMKEYDTYDGDIDYYDENDQKYGSVIYSDATGTGDNMGTLNIIQDGDAAMNVLTNDPLASVQSVGSEDTMDNEHERDADEARSTSPILTQSQTQTQSPAQARADSLSTERQLKAGAASNSSAAGAGAAGAVPRRSLNLHVQGSAGKGGALKKGQYSQSSRRVVRGQSPSGGAVAGFRHSRQFSKRKSTAQAAAARAGRKLGRQKSYNMSIEWTYSTRPSLNMLNVPMRGEDGAAVDLYDDHNTDSNTNTNTSPNHTSSNTSASPSAGKRRASANKGRKIKSKSIGNPTNATYAAAGAAAEVVSGDEVMSDNDDFEFNGGTMVRSEVSTPVHSKRNSKRKPVACYEIGIQTDRATRFDKGVQTDNRTVGNLVSLRTEILAICDKIETDLSDKGKDELTVLKNKIREMIRLKITHTKNDKQDPIESRLKDLRTKLDARTNSKHGKM